MADISKINPNGDIYDIKDTTARAGLNLKADKVLNATANNFATLDSNGNLTDSGKKASDFMASDGVVANPQGTATGTLTKLGIGSDIYDIQGGGGVIDGSTITPTDDIQTWLQCAGLHQNYTTLNEVLADSGVLSALMESSNACDYLVRSTTWASTICSNEIAMSYIGVNNYCADRLLNNNIWRTTICNSTYFESVLNVKVPKMTGYSTPSGEVIEVNHYNNYYGYYVFDEVNKNKTYTTDHIWYTTKSLAEGKWVGYVFPQNLKLYKAETKLTHGAGTVSQDVGIEIEYSINGTDWIKLNNTEMSAVVTNQAGRFDFSNLLSTSFETSSCCYIRALGTRGSNLGIAYLQFYGRSSSAYNPTYNEDDNVNISAIAPYEPLSTSSRAYAVGEHFYKNGKFCTCIAQSGIAQGAQFTLGTNYVEGTVADAIAEKNKPVLFAKNYGSYSVNTLAAIAKTNNNVDISQYNFIEVVCHDSESNIGNVMNYGGSSLISLRRWIEMCEYFEGKTYPTPLQLYIPFPAHYVNDMFLLVRQTEDYKHTLELVVNAKQSNLYFDVYLYK